MFFLTYGDTGPRVVLVQTLLRLKNINVRINGVWDEPHMRAVEQYRASLNLRPMGPVDGNVFFHLIQDSKLKMIHSIDASAGAVRVWVEREVKQAGIDPLLNERIKGGGVANAVNKIVARAKDHRIAMLTIHGHGNRGNWISLAIGDPVHAQTEGRTKDYEAMKADYKSYIDNSHFQSNRPALSKITPLFAPFGNAEVHACKIGKQKKLLQRLADTWGVPVTGGMENQKAGGYTVNKWGEYVPNNFVLQGEVFTAYPGGLDMATWAANIESMVPNLAKWLAELQKALARLGK